VNTRGGTAPPTCAGASENISVPYAAEYWIFREAVKGQLGTYM